MMTLEEARIQVESCSECSNGLAVAQIFNACPQNAIEEQALQVLRPQLAAAVKVRNERALAKRNL